ncbi:hypothetical protein CUMW_165040 [Citrus unshiu]|nr:hypothetical protein CUMW_165040 [Citrus unshiu]
MDISQSHGVEMMRLIIAVALVAIGARTAYYFYVTKKPKGGRGDLGEEVIKPHTPATLDSDIGYFELVIKMYLQGRMSHHFHELQEGDYLPMKGPDPSRRFDSLLLKGRFKYQPGQVEAFGTLTGDTGIAPMFQVARAILENPNDKTNVYLIYANVTFYDILLMEELDNLATIFF